MEILISGASIAGPALAFWLGRQNHNVTLVERAAALREGGYAVDIRGAALAVIERMGLRERLRPLQTDTQSNSVVDARGRRFGRLARGFGVIDPDDVEIHRGDLARVLYEASCAQTHYRFGDGIATLEQRSDRVAVRFESGERRDYDAVIGADGVHSRTRALAFGPEPSFVRPLGSAMAIFTIPNFLGLDREQLLFNALGRIASVKSANANRELKLCLFFTSAVASFDPRDVDGQRRLVAEAFRGAGWEFARFIDAMWKADDFYCDLTCQVRMDRRHAGRVALVGDAGYCPSPLSGQGTSLALVGAYVLARSLGACGGDVAAAFARYDAAIRSFVARNQEVALAIAKGFAPTSPFQLWSRNLVLALLPNVPGAGMIMKLMLGGVRKASLAIDLGPPEREPLAERPPAAATAF